VDETHAASGDLLIPLIFLAAATFAVPLFKRLGLGAVLGYLDAGHRDRAVARHRGPANDATEQLGTPVRLARDGLRLTVGAGGCTSMGLAIGSASVILQA